MKLKKEYSFTNNRTIWRLLPTETGKLVIEERIPDKKEAFFNCIDIRSGKKIFADLQFDEKFWIGIESIHKDIIIFHKFAKPDMPGHKGIFVFDIESQSTIWKNENLTFLFMSGESVYGFIQQFEGKKIFRLNAATGAVIEDLGSDFEIISRLHSESDSIDYSNYIFPEPYSPVMNNNPSVQQIIDNFKSEQVISGRIEHALYKNNLLLLNYHDPAKGSSLRNNFAAVDIDRQKIIFEEVLNESTNMFIPESFFIKDDLLFLLIEKIKLKVYSIIE